MNYTLLKKFILKELNTWAPNKPLLEQPDRSWLGSDLIYKASLISYKGSEPVFEVWKKEFFLDAFVYAHIYTNASTGTTVLHSCLGFKEIPGTI
ncbi:hypothetical protein [Algoriphagus namhaensis]